MSWTNYSSKHFRNIYNINSSTFAFHFIFKIHCYNNNIILCIISILFFFFCRSHNPLTTKSEPHYKSDPIIVHYPPFDTKKKSISSEIWQFFPFTRTCRHISCLSLIFLRHLHQTLFWKIEKKLESKAKSKSYGIWLWCHFQAREGGREGGSGCVRIGQIKGGMKGGLWDAYPFFPLRSMQEDLFLA